MIWISFRKFMRRVSQFLICKVKTCVSCSTHRCPPPPRLSVLRRFLSVRGVTCVLRVSNDVSLRVASTTLNDEHVSQLHFILTYLAALQRRESYSSLLFFFFFFNYFFFLSESSAWICSCYSLCTIGCGI